MLFVAVDEHARRAFTAMPLDEKKGQTVLFLRNAVTYGARMAVVVQPVLTDTGASFRSEDFRLARIELGIKRRFTRPYRAQPNGKAERLIDSALRAWAHGWTCQNSAQRTEPLAHWQHRYTAATARTAA